MSTVAEIRLQNLNFLIEQYKTIANLNVALGRTRTDSTLSQIKNKVKINNQSGRRSMGYELARTIEEKLNLTHGWMDTFHENIQPNKGIVEREGAHALSQLKPLISIPVYMQPTKEQAGNSNLILKGEIQLPNLLIDSITQGTSSDLRAYVPTEGAMFKTLPMGSIVIVNFSITEYVGDGLYFIVSNGVQKFRKITQLLDGSFEIESDLKKEITNDIKAIEIIGKASNIWYNQKV